MERSRQQKERRDEKSREKRDEKNEKKNEKLIKAMETLHLHEMVILFF